MATQNGGGGLRRAASSATLPPPRSTAPGGAARLQLGAVATPAPSTPSGGDFITLAAPRPGVARTRNEYIETPFRPPPQLAGPLAAGGGSGSNKGSSHTLPLATTSGLKLEELRGNSSSSSSTLPGVHLLQHGVHHHPPPLPPSHHLHHLNQQQHHHLHHPSQQHHHHHHPNHFQHRPLNQQVIQKQPGSATLKKEAKAATVAPPPPPEDDEQDGGGHASSPSEAPSIICRRCRKCRCDACRNPKPLPSAWICEDRYQCSPETTLDYCSCMCCVKGLLYHCMKDREMDDDVRCADRPCSCSTHRRCTRWGCVAALLPVLPCLLCYWPLKGCFKLCEMAYTKYSSQGCRCRDSAVAIPNSSSSSSSVYSSGGKKQSLDPLPNKRLLDTSAVEC